MTVIIAGFARTPFARFAGALSPLSAVDLGAHATAAALRRSGIDPLDVDHVLAGQVLQAGAGQNPARQAAIGAGIPLSTPALTVNAVCLSGMEAVAAGARLIRSGEADVVVAIGQESMSGAPRLLRGTRNGTRYGALEAVDAIVSDGLDDAFERRSMGSSTEQENGVLGLTREEQDAWSVRSHLRAAASADILREEIEPITVSSGRTSTLLDADDGIRSDATIDALGRLRPAFADGGTITAGNASPITDGAAAVVLIGEAEARRRGITGLARLLSHALVAGPGLTLHAQPATAITAALRRSGRTVEELTAVEINEAFAAVAVESTRLLRVDPGIVNAHGGAIALGHPIGASGARLVGHLAARLHRRGAGALGAAGICGGGGQGSAVVLEAL